MQGEKAFVSLRLRWQLLTPFHVGSGEGAAGFVHRAVMRNSGARAYIPGSAVKGRVAHYARALYRAVKGETCPWQRVRTEWERSDDPGPVGCGCDLCALFGAPGFAPGALTFSPLVPPARIPVTPRTSAALDPARRAVVEGRLFTQEAAGSAGDALTGTVSGWIPGRHLGQRVGLLVAALRLVQQLGGGRSRGLGWGEMQVDLAGMDDLEGWIRQWI